MPRLTTENHTLYYTTAGKATDPPLLILHGFLGSHLDFAATLPALSEHFYCITPDLPGHGQTLTAPGSYTFPTTTKTLLSLLDHLSITRTHLLGYSMGGRLALYLVCHFPERFRRVVLESASPGLKTAAERRQRVKKDEAIAHQLETMSLSDFLTQWYTNPLFLSLKNFPEHYEVMLRCRQANDPIELSYALRGFSTGRQPSLWHQLSHISSPLLLLVGTLDHKFAIINRSMLAHYQRNRATQAVLKACECGHNIHREAPNTYSQIVSNFLQKPW
ncbi:2-succinyl-6-hydroxy-2,4-cyclohexadiene-1-carboxylate synthase [Leptolyngbya sp. BC1307]|uniref:2-succinyl-6-hydroxy-2, 4-cyclohexadiene-1-carboxylate synthase n=1 Tax=Leptolyngbya sp. BC1307 TaxID=2029589 RepID=UPI000EFCD2D1|nr:2-succinyl-6-hydroxy-2,4-cyclohexadiene-1-carboxylate synthase [Leptolyngbya sp. BC1307]